MGTAMSRRNSCPGFRPSRFLTKSATWVWARHDYTVKVDPDAVFFPNKLVEALRGMGVPAEGVYLENCPFVEYGYFGSFEVYSKNAFGTLLLQAEDCYAGMNWKVGIKNKKYIPSCSGTAAAVIHPFKKPDAWFKCMEEADQVFPAPRHDHR